MSDGYAELLAEIADLEAQLAELQIKYDDSFKQWRSEFWRAENAEHNLEALLTSINKTLEEQE